MKYCMIEIAFDNEQELNDVINKLLKERLVSGCQVVEGSSKWRWKDEIEMSKEYLLFVKTKKELEDYLSKLKSEKKRIEKEENEKRTLCI